MSLFGSLMGDFDDDMGFMGNPMGALNAHMRSMNRLMNSFHTDPFNMLGGFDNGMHSNALMERGHGMGGGGLFGFPPMPNINRLLNADIGAGNGASYCSSSVITMSSGPDGRPQIYQASQSTKAGPGGVMETRKTVQDSVSGVKKMAIGHHIGERAHIIEKEQDLRSGQLEERQEFINLDEEEAEDFDREFVTRANRVRPGAAAAIMPGPSKNREVVTIEEIDDDDDNQKVKHKRQLPALHGMPPTYHHSSSDSTQASDMRNSASVATATSSKQNSVESNYMNSSPAHRRLYRSHLSGGISPRRSIRSPTSSPLATTPTTPAHSTIATSPSVHPYNAASRRHHRSSKHHQGHKQRVVDVDAVATTSSAPNAAEKSPKCTKTRRPSNEE